MPVPQVWSDRVWDQSVKTQFVISKSGLKGRVREVDGRAKVDRSFYAFWSRLLSSLMTVQFRAFEPSSFCFSDRSFFDSRTALIYDPRLEPSTFSRLERLV